MTKPLSDTTIVWPPLIRRCVVDLAKIMEANKTPEAFDLMAARLQTLLDEHQTAMKEDTADGQ